MYIYLDVHKDGLPAPVARVGWSQREPSPQSGGLAGVIDDAAAKPSVVRVRSQE